MSDTGIMHPGFIMSKSFQWQRVPLLVQTCLCYSGLVGTSERNTEPSSNWAKSFRCSLVLIRLCSWSNSVHSLTLVQSLTFNKDTNCQEALERTIFLRLMATITGLSSTVDRFMRTCFALNKQSFSTRTQTSKDRTFRANLVTLQWKPLNQCHQS